VPNFFQLKTTILKLFLLIIFAQNSYSQCFEIESILVDACGAEEGLNEMVRFKLGGVPLNTATINVSWPNNSWQGLIQNTTTASKVAILNADIVNAGGCGQLFEPSGGVLPANAAVILVTSFNFDTSLNSFGALSEDTYIIFQNNPAVTAGHFANFGTGLRTLTMFLGSCVDVVTYDRSLLVSPTGETTGSDGSTVLFDPIGNATYVNFGCSATVQPFLVEIINSSLTVCPGDSIQLTATSEGQQSVLWTAPVGVFSNPTALTTSYTVPSNAAGTILLRLTATNICGLEIFDTILVTVTDNIVPDFATSLTLCDGTSAPALNTTSPNGILGTWNPSTIDNTLGGNYVFTPNANQCASPITLVVTITNNIVPDFATSLTLCSETSAPPLNTTSPNGILGTWNPSTIDNTLGGNYVFTPNANQCASPITLVVTVTDNIVPNFATSLTLCNGTSTPPLNTSSPNGILGTWNPSTIDNTLGGNYVFTPNGNQCASPITLVVTISDNIVPDFSTSLTLCSETSAPALNTTSPNGILGTWNPSTINNTTDGNYIFTPNDNLCASQITLVVTISDNIVPDFATSLTLCTGTSAPALNTTSPNGILGTWNPSTINNISGGNYIFTPNANQCASPITLSVNTTNFDFSFNQKCDGRNFIIEAFLENPLTDFNYEWTLENSATLLSEQSFLDVTELLNSNSIANSFPITFSLKIFTDEGCEETKPITIFNAFCGIPKGISPNNDGLNDSFDLTGLGVDSISIFNRYGREIYSKNNYLDEWYGQSDKGHELPDGTYYFLLNKSDGKQVTGWVYIIR
jgi:gliding motility-associated-like protein